MAHFFVEMHFVFSSMNGKFYPVKRLNLLLGKDLIKTKKAPIWCLSCF